MYCGKCGSEIPDGASVCPNCGADMNGKGIMKYLTRDNIEMLISVCGLVPLAYPIASGIPGIFTKILVIGYLFKAVRFLAGVAAVAAAAGSVAGAAYIIYKDPSMRSAPGYLAGAASLTSLITLLMEMGNVHGTFIFGLISLVLSLDMISRVFIQNMGLCSPVMPSQDFAVYKDYIGLVFNARKEEAKYREFTAGSPDPSYFDGDGLDYLGYILVTALISAVTFSIATPWLICRNLRWRKSHTVINGRRLAFTGTGGQLIGLWIKWILLTAITLGIYSLFAYVDYLKWETKHTFYADENPQPGAVNPNSMFDGNTLQYVGYSLLCGLITGFTVGIGFAWGFTMLRGWMTKHIIISGDRMSFDGKGLQFLGESIIIFLLTAITLGIYSPWGAVRLNRWVYSHTRRDSFAGYQALTQERTPEGYIPF